MRRDALKRGVIWYHPDGIGHGLYIALSGEDGRKLGRSNLGAMSHVLWSVVLENGDHSLVWTNPESRCVLRKPESLSVAEILLVTQKAEWAAGRGVQITPLCGLLYKEEET